VRYPYSHGCWEGSCRVLPGLNPDVQMLLFQQAAASVSSSSKIFLQGGLILGAMWSTAFFLCVSVAKLVSSGASATQRKTPCNSLNTNCK